MDNSAVDFPQIYDAFHPKILRYLTRLVGETEAEDLLQEVFIIVNQALGPFAARRSFPPGSTASPPMPP